MLVLPHSHCHGSKLGRHGGIGCCRRNDDKWLSETVRCDHDDQSTKPTTELAINSLFTYEDLSKEFGASADSLTHLFHNQQTGIEGDFD